MPLYDRFRYSNFFRRRQIDGPGMYWRFKRFRHHPRYWMMER